ncbi:MAG: PAS domain-containing protein [Tannerellaceae bacterium]|jgi:nitrogen fixation/metabolism regulation signal transduction histidine kinase|nr:PAS domain-containing protein [Tannerellaceae bacterium]
MRTRTGFLIFSVMLLGLLGLTAFFALRRQSSNYALYAVEALAVISIIYLIFFYFRMIRPLHIIGNGMDLLSGQDFASRLRKVGNAEADRIVELFNRMMKQLKNERLQVRSQNEFLDLLVKASPVGIVILDLDEKVMDYNPAAGRMLGLGEDDKLRGKRLGELKLPLATELVGTGRHSSRIVRLSNADVYKCSHSTFFDRGFLHSFYLVEPLTEEVRRAETKAYEKVIRMIAHEVNNTTAGVTSTLDTLSATLSDSEANEEVVEALRIVVERTLGMNRFVGRFADVVRIPDAQLREHSLNEMVSSCKRFMEAICANRNIRIVMNLSQSSPVVMADAQQFEQALVNIIKNAAEAIEQDGTITIVTLSGPHPLLEIADTGRGVDAATASKLFTPFFSTKPHGQGLGLIFVREILQRHGCSFSLRTGDDGQTRFRIVF